MTEDSDPVVLVVEDERELADFYATWLEDSYDVRVAYGGEEALEAYDPAVDVVLLDRRMPNMSGDEVLDGLHDRGADARVAMVTAVSPEFDIVEMGFDDYLVKPVTREELRRTVDELLALTEYHDRVQEYYSLSAKHTTLRTNKSGEEIDESEEFESLVEELSSIEHEFENIREELDYEQLQNAFRVIDFDAPPEDVPVEDG